MIATTLLLTALLTNIHHALSDIRSEFTYTLDPGYPIGENLFGSIAGVDVDKKGNIIIFHRGSHKWTASTFDENDNYLPSQRLPIKEETVVTIDPKEQSVIRAWGSNRFFMPHGISLDHDETHVWLTDVALHQVFKFPVNGSRETIVLGTAFEPGNDDTHFCKPTSAADTGDFVFVADGYCNSRIVMFSSKGEYLGQFGQSSTLAFFNGPGDRQPTFKIPHKIVYAEEASMLCVADRENGRIQVFSFNPKRLNKEGTMMLNGAIESKFTIADPLFNGKLFSVDYSPIGGGILVAVSGSGSFNKPPLGFVYNVTTGQLISQFSPSPSQTFGMAHDLAITGRLANSIYVVDIAPVNLWKFSRLVNYHKEYHANELRELADAGFHRAISLVSDNEHKYGIVWLVFLVTIILLVAYTCIAKTKRLSRCTGPHTFASLYSSNYPNSINNLFSYGRFNNRSGLNRTRAALSTMFGRRAFHNLWNKNQQQQNDFSRIPLEDSDNSDDDKSDSDVEEFNINQATPSIKIDV